MVDFLTLAFLDGYSSSPYSSLLFIVLPDLRDLPDLCDLPDLRVFPDLRIFSVYLLEQFDRALPSTLLAAERAEA